MTQPTKVQWDEVAARLDRWADPVYLSCDGYLVRATMARVDTNRLAIAVAVNGWEFKGAWCTFDDEPMAEEARRFWRPVRRIRMKKKELALWETLIGKRECRRRGYYEPMIYPVPHWNRPRPFIAHLKRHNEHISIIDYTTYRSAVEKKQADEAAQ